MNPTLGSLMNSFGATNRKYGESPMPIMDDSPVGPNFFGKAPLPPPPAQAPQAALDPAYEAKVKAWRQINDARSQTGKPPRPWDPNWGPMPR